jgi:hypothetical protein
MRTALIFFDMTDSCDIPSAAEPFFMGLDAQISFEPVMNADEMACWRRQGDGGRVGSRGHASWRAKRASPNPDCGQHGQAVGQVPTVHAGP